LKTNTIGEAQWCRCRLFHETAAQNCMWEGRACSQYNTSLLCIYNIHCIKL